MAGDTPATVPEKSYHHGQLRQSLVDTALTLLREGGLDAFSLRVVARRVGVSAAAPAHHFGSARGLLTAVAVVGYGDLLARLRAVDGSGLSLREVLRQRVAAYIGFAIAEPGLYQLMFRRDLIDRDDAEYRAASMAAISLLDSAISQDAAASRGGVEVGPATPAPCTPPRDGMTLASIAPFMEAFSMVHGLAMLAIERKFDGVLTEADRSDFCGRVVPVILDARWPLPKP